MATTGQSPTPDPLAPGATLSHYQITGKIGEGGMGAVYKAIDRNLGRPVALKVISRSFITPDDRRRFAREANAASALNHPNIVTIYEYDSVDGLDLIAMEFIEGETLDHQLTFHPKRDPLPARLEILRQVAAALFAAHSAGIVHRDLKPANIMITPGGHVKVLDFGLAKRDTARDDATLTALTQVGAVMGTPAYMSPEQALGEPTDWRTDIFSFGVILYEVVCGKRPFQGRNAMAILNAVVNLRHDPPATPIRPLAALIESCLVKDRTLRLQSLATAVTALSPNSSATSGTPPAIRIALPSRRITFAAAALLAATLLWAARRPIQSWLTVNAPAIVSSSAYSHFQSGTAILQRRDRKAHPDLALAEFEKAIAADPAFAAAHAGLADAYTVKFNDTPDLQWLRLARQSAEKAVALTPELAAGHAALARVALAQKDLTLAEKELQTAISLDPRRADAFRTLGVLHRTRKDLPAAEKAFQTAIALDPADWLTPFELGGLYYANARYADAATVWRNATTQTPDNSPLFRNLGSAYHMLGQHDEAASAFQKSLEIAPSPFTFNNLGTIRYFQGRYDDAIAAFEKAVDSRPNSYLFWANLGDAYRWGTGTRPKAAAAYTRAIQLARASAKSPAVDTDTHSRIALYLAKLGDAASTRAQLNSLPTASRSASMWFRIAVARELLGERDLALAALGQALSAGYPKNEIETEPELALLRSDRRFHIRMAQTDPPSAPAK